jgi:acetyl-CoA carboxylase carboxyl transferase subunit beta
MPIFPRRSLKAGNQRKRDMPEGLWQKCPTCGEVIHNLELTQNLMVCPKCDHHFTFSAKDRIASLVDPDSFQEMDGHLASLDVLNFKGVATYGDRLKNYQAKTGLEDAVITGLATIEGLPIALAAMDYHFLAATMGSVVGEKITRLIERGTTSRRPVVIFCASGGARMYEGMFSLMQMAKTSGALTRHDQAKLPYLAILTHATTAGVMASFASLGDLIISEPKAMIGFAGPRVIRETTNQELPAGFQTAEFLLARGLIDLIVRRQDMRSTICHLLNFLAQGPR